MSKAIIIALIGLLQDTPIAPLPAPHGGWLTEPVLIALIGYAGVVTTALVTVLVAWMTTRKEGREDRDLADRVLDSWELLVSSQARRCSLPDGEKAASNGETGGKPSTGKPSDA